MVNLLREEFREVEIKGCRLHLGQAWYRKIQSLGLAQDYKDKSSEIGKWLSQFFGLPFLPPDETVDSFVEEMIPEAPTNERCSKFSDYLLETYVDENSKYPPTMWASKPCSTAKRINNDPECFHSHFNDQFYSAHPCIYVFIDVLKQIQTTTYIKIRGLDNPATVRRTEKEKLALFSLEQYRRLETGEISRATYMKSMGLKCSARTDL